MMSCLDTNVLVRFLTAAKSDKYRNLYPFFKSLETGTKQVELKQIVLFQTIFVLTSYYDIPRTLVADRMLALLSYKGIKIRDLLKNKRMLSLWRDTTLDIVDCYLVACLHGKEGGQLYSYDRDFDRFGIDRVEP